MGDLAGDLTLQDLDGQTHRLRDLRGKRVVHLVFWATWCVPCIQEIPTLRDIYTRYHDRGLEILGVAASLDETPEGVRSLARDLKINYPVLWDEGSAAMKSYRVDYIPQNFLIGRDGIIRYTGVGLPSDYETLVEKLLQDGGATEASAR
ncbi:MAG TPA: TlpA disulfide reductase family protein [Candidatus Polarisedimenticolia bacterium]|nr:TlpA disulfide reductase family protein [Candidatus Polarisedimenticolia bacterium]